MSWPFTVAAITDDAPHVQSASFIRLPPADAPPTARSAAAPSAQADEISRSRFTTYKRRYLGFGYGLPPGPSAPTSGSDPQVRPLFKVGGGYVARSRPWRALRSRSGRKR